MVVWFLEGGFVDFIIDKVLVSEYFRIRIKIILMRNIIMDLGINYNLI